VAAAVSIEECYAAAASRQAVAASMPINDPVKRAQPIPEALLEEAALWHARLRDGGSAGVDNAGFARWLAADALHGAAYAEMERLWIALERPVMHLLAKEDAVVALPRAVKRGWLPIWRAGALAACLLLALSGGYAWRGGILDDLRSDYVTAIGAQRSIALTDGSQVILNTDSALAVGFTPDRRVARLFRGEAWFSVAHDAERPFVVETPEGTVQVTGTQFNVRIADRQAIVSLVEGNITLSSADPSPGRTDLVAGQQAVLTTDGIEAATGFDAAAVTAWQHGRIVFYQTPLKQVVDQLNRYRPGWVVVASDRLRNLRVTGIFAVKDPDEALAVIQNTLHVRIIKLTDYLAVLR
jgi:transmembrane sensor